MSQDDRGGRRVLALLARAFGIMAALAPQASAWEKISAHPGGPVLQYLPVENRKLILTLAGVHAREAGQPAWTLMEPPCGSHVDELHAHGSAVLANSHQGKPCLSRDGGRTWKAVASGPVGSASGNPDLGMVRYFGVHGLYTSAFFDPDFALFRSPDTGRTWRRLTDFDPASLVDAGPEFLLSDHRGGVYRMDPVTGRLSSATTGLPTSPDLPYYLMGKAPGIILATTGEAGTGVYRYLRAANRWEPLLADYGHMLPLLTNEGARVFLFVSTAPDSLSLWRSLDGGETWQRRPAISTEPPQGLWVEGDTLIYGSWDRSLVRREWSSPSEIRWDQGIHATLPQEVRLQGRTLYIDADNFAGYRRTRDRGATWEAVSDTAYEVLHITGNQAYMTGEGYLDRLDPTGPGRQRLAYPAMDQSIHKLFDAGDRLYARSFFQTGPRDGFSILFSAPKTGRLVWGDNLPFPFQVAQGFAAFGDTVVAINRDTLAYSKDGAKTWTRLDRKTSGSYPVDGTYHLVHHEGGQWLVWNGFQLYLAADPAGPWRRMTAPIDTCLNYRLSGSRVLLQAWNQAQLSSDGGRTWKALTNPLQVGWDQISNLDLSDSMVCVNYSVDTRCLELDPLPVGGAAPGSRLAPVKPAWVRRSGRMMVRDPRRPGGAALHGVDGRATVLPEEPALRR